MPVGWQLPLLPHSIRVASCRAVSGSMSRQTDFLLIFAGARSPSRLARIAAMPFTFPPARVEAAGVVSQQPSTARIRCSSSPTRPPPSSTAPKVPTRPRAADARRMLMHTHTLHARARVRTTHIRTARLRRHPPHHSGTSCRRAVWTSDRHIDQFEDLDPLEDDPSINLHTGMRGLRENANYVALSLWGRHW